jgi:hypothetical protein
MGGAISGRGDARPAAAKLALPAYLPRQLTLPGAIWAGSRPRQHAQARCPRVLPAGPPPPYGRHEVPAVKEKK